MSDPFRRFDDYDFGHFVALRAGVGATDDVHRLFALRDDAGRHAWFAAREARGELAGYVDDLEIATELAYAEQPGVRTIGLLTSYALLAAILRDTAARLSPALAAALVRAGVWSRDHALAWADVSPDREDALALVRQVLNEPGGLREELGIRALTAGAAIGDPDNKVLSVAALAQQLAPHQRGRALDVIARESNEGSRLGGLENILRSLPPALLPRALAVAEGFHQSELRAEALAAVGERLEEPDRGRAYGAALEAAREAAAGERRPGMITPLTRFAQRFPEALLPEVLALAEGLGADALTAVLAAALERRADAAPDEVLVRARELPRAYVRAGVQRTVAVAFARAGRPGDALVVCEEIADDEHAAGALAPHLPPERLGELIELTERLRPHHRIEALRAIARVPGAPGDALRRAAERLPNQDHRRKAQLAIVPALSGDAVDEVLGDEPGLQGMSEAAEGLPRAQVVRVLDAARGTRVSGLDCDDLSALLVRLARLGEPGEALARLAELDGMWEYDRAKVLAALVPELTTELLPRARALVQPDKIALARLRTRASLAAAQPPGTLEREAERLPDAYDRLRAFTWIFDGTGSEQAAAGILTALRATLDHPSLDRRADHAQGWRRLGQAPSDGALATALTLDDVDDRFTALLALTPAYAEAAAGLVDLVATHRGSGAFVAREAPSREIRRRFADALISRAPDALARGVVELAELLPRDAVAPLVARLRVVRDTHLRLSALYALAPRMPAELRRRVAREEVKRREDVWLMPLAEDIWSRCLIARCDRAAADGLEPPVDALRDWHERARAALLVAEAFGTTIGGELLDDALETGGPVEALIPGLDPDGVRRVVAALDRVAPSFRRQEVLAALARRALRLGEDQLALRCLREPAFQIEKAVEAVAAELPQPLLEPCAEIGRGAFAALARRAAELGDGGTMLALVDRLDERDVVLAELAPLAPAETVPALLERARDSAAALAALVPRVPRAERLAVVSAAVTASAEYVLARAESRVVLLHALTPELARLRLRELTRLYGEAVRASASWGREEVLIDIRAFAPTLQRRLGPEVAAVLDAAITLAGGDRWSV